MPPVEAAKKFTLTEGQIIRLFHIQLWDNAKWYDTNYIGQTIEEARESAVLLDSDAITRVVTAQFIVTRRHIDLFSERIDDWELVLGS